MVRRSNVDQTLHDKVVETYADELAEDGWEVEADNVEGYVAPPEINGQYPDVYAESGVDKLVVEVETSRSEDHAQRRAFKQWAENQATKEYRGVVAHADGSWTRFESA